MRLFLFCFFATFLLAQATFAQSAIEPMACPFAIDSSVKTRCAYLIVPENRKQSGGKTIKLPFIVAYSNNPHKQKSPLLFTTGGPGGSSLGWIRGAIHIALTDDRDCIAFEQRGTRYAVPCLDGPELGDAIRMAYRKNLNKDSMMRVGALNYKKALQAKGIDLASYNTDATVNDIGDLLDALVIDSINLLGGSYSGGLMLAVLQKYPSRVRSLVLDSPLPTFVPIDEDEPANFNEALGTLFTYADSDSTDRERYGNLEMRFRSYFTSIGGRKFTIPYTDTATGERLQVEYTRADLLDVIDNTLSSSSENKDVPYIITEMIMGHHDQYIRPRLDWIFHGNPGPKGMRLSVYCADQKAYHDENILRQVYKPYPWMEGYHINDVYRELCDCWQSPPIAPATKKPFYSDRPALLADGAMDPACRPLYIDRIHHYLPNSQRFLFLKGSHMVFTTAQTVTLVKAFLANPYERLASPGKDITAY